MVKIPTDGSIFYAAPNNRKAALPAYAGTANTDSRPLSSLPDQN
jgi:hypothetical protein